MFEPPVAGNLKPSGDVKMELELRLRSRYRSPLKRDRRGDGKCRVAVCVCLCRGAGGRAWTTWCDSGQCLARTQCSHNVRNLTYCRCSPNVQWKVLLLLNRSWHLGSREGFILWWSLYCNQDWFRLALNHPHSHNVIALNAVSSSFHLPLHLSLLCLCCIIISTAIFFWAITLLRYRWISIFSFNFFFFRYRDKCQILSYFF